MAARACSSGSSAPPKAKQSLLSCAMPDHARENVAAVKFFGRPPQKALNIEPLGDQYIYFLISRYSTVEIESSI